MRVKMGGSFGSFETIPSGLDCPVAVFVPAWEMPVFLGGGALEYAADFCEFVVLGQHLHFGLHHPAL